MDLSEKGEKDPFKDFADEWWNPKGTLSSLHKINPLRFGWFKSKMDSLKGLKVLDVGCGGGLLSEEFAKEGALVTGIDLSNVAIKAARQHAEESGLKIDYRVSTAVDMQDEKNNYDVLVCAEVLEHVDDLEKFVKDCSYLLKPGGSFFFGTLNKTFTSRFFAIFIAEDILGMVPKGTHDFNRFIKPSALTYLLRDNSIDVKELKGISFIPWALDFRISKDLSINYMGYGVKEVMKL